MKFKIGDKVILLPKGSSWFAHYTNEIAEVVRITPPPYPIPYRVKVNDGHTFDSPEEYLDLYKEYDTNWFVDDDDDFGWYYPETDDHKKACNHENKYLNVISRTLKFWYCPDCGKDWNYEED